MGLCSFDCSWSCALQYKRASLTGTKAKGTRFKCVQVCQKWHDTKDRRCVSIFNQTLCFSFDCTSHNHCDCALLNTEETEVWYSKCSWACTPALLHRGVAFRGISTAQGDHPENVLVKRSTRRGSRACVCVEVMLGLLENPTRGFTRG